MRSSTFSIYPKVYLSTVLLLFLFACNSGQQGNGDETVLLTEKYDTVSTSGRAVNPENSEEVFHERDITRTKPVPTRLNKEIEDNVEPAIPTMVEPVFPEFWEPEQLAVRTLSTVEEDPVFTPFCVSSSQPKACSDRAFREYVEERKSEVTQAAFKAGQTVQWLRFWVDEKGGVNDVVLVNTWGVPCTKCAEYALKWVKEMPQWQPARQNDRPVNARVEVPVVF
jgi:hypothetical protein